MHSFGDYVLVQRLSVGGMAELFLAYRAGDPRRELLVVKRILPRLLERSDIVTMFLDEARLTSHLFHENLVQVYDVGQAQGTPYIAMEYVDGLSLSELLARYPGRALPLPLACWIAAEACAGLGYAHARTDLAGLPLGIVHRDVSPDNVLISQGGQVKVADFGIAKATIHLTRTRPGQVKGKLAYMSPEQLRRHQIDHRSDIFSVGAVLYEMTTGRRPFAAKNEVDLLRSLIEADFPPPERDRPDCPEALSRIIRRALAREPANRYQAMRILRRDLLQLVPAGDRTAELAGLVQQLCREKPRRGRDVVPTASATALDERGSPPPAGGPGTVPGAPPRLTPQPTSEELDGDRGPTEVEQLVEVDDAVYSEEVDTLPDPPPRPASFRRRN